MEYEKPNYYAIITAEVRYDKNLKPMEKLMYGELTALANKYGYSNASNKYFTNLFEVHKNTISSWISKLNKLKYVTVKLIYKENSKEVIERRIYINNANNSISEHEQIADTNTNINNYTTSNEEKEKLISIGKEITNQHLKTIKAEFDSFLSDDLNVRGFKNYNDITKKWKAWCNQIKKVKVNSKEITKSQQNNNNPEQKNYRWEFRKAQDTSDKIKKWLEFDLKINWMDKYYWEDIPNFIIKTNQGDLKIGWKEVMHPDFNKKEILLYKIQDKNLIEENIIDV